MARRRKIRTQSALNLSGVVLVTAIMLASAGPRTLAQTTHTVELIGTNFVPQNIVIDVGDIVHWVWVSGLHNVESGVVVNGVGVHDGIFISGSPTGIGGTTYDLTFDEAFLQAHPMPDNRYDYYCIVHTSVDMVGTVTVVRAGDFNVDGLVNLVDHSIQNECLTGPGSGATPGDCSMEESQSADMNGDGRVDMKDFAAFQRAFRG